MKRDAFSLIELTVVIIIISISALLGFPYYYRIMEKTKAKNAEFNLANIRNKETRYNLDNDAYFLCPPPCNQTTLENALGLNIEDPCFSYDIRAIGNGYRVTATRNNAAANPCSGKTITVTDATSNLTTGCSYW